MIIVEDWINSPRYERTKHLVLDEDCIERGGNSTVHRGVLAQYLNTNFPSKVDLCHACHNAKCSNPRHLYWGTRKENIKDAQMNGTFVSVWDNQVRKHGLENAKKLSTSRLNHSNGGKANKGKAKSEEHRRKISQSLRARASGEIGDTRET